MILLKLRRLEILALCLLISIGLAGCECTVEQSESLYTAGENSGPLHEINAAEYGSAEIPETDTLQLVFPCLPGNPELSEGLAYRANGRSIFLWFASASAKRSRSSRSAAQVLQAHFPSQNYTLTMRPASNPQVQVMAGDANNDGKINMLDLFPVAYGIKKFVGSQIAQPMNTTIQGGSSFNRMPTGNTWNWNNQNTQVDFIHADCNGDGVIDRSDAEMVERNLDPLQLPNMLRAFYTNIGLSATLSTQHPIEVYNYQAASQNRTEVRVWYDIRVAQPANANGDKILGVVFTRPVAEDPGRYQVLHIQINTDYSRLVGNQADLLGLQRYWDIPIQVPDSCKGPQAVSKPLDVGVFNTADIQRVTQHDCIISCGVTIDDMLRTAGNGGVTHIYQHLTNVVIFRQAADGTITAETTDCSFDAVDLTKVEDIVTYTSEDLPGNWWSNPNNGKD